MPMWGHCATVCFPKMLSILRTLLKIQTFLKQWKSMPNLIIKRRFCGPFQCKKLWCITRCGAAIVAGAYRTLSWWSHEWHLQVRWVAWLLWAYCCSWPRRSVTDEWALEILWLVSLLLQGWLGDPLRLGGHGFRLLLPVLLLQLFLLVLLLLFLQLLELFLLVQLLLLLSKMYKLKQKWIRQTSYACNTGKVN